MAYRYVAYTFIAVVFSFLLHEFTHWSMGELLGYDMEMTLNVTSPKIGAFSQDWQYTLVSAVGPFITLLQSFVFFLWIKKSSQKNLYPFLFSSFYLDLLSGIMNYRHPNDMGRISTTFHLGLFTLPIIFVAMHSLMIYKTTVREQYRWRFNLWTLLWVLVFSSALILINQRYHVVII